MLDTVDAPVFGLGGFGIFSTDGDAYVGLGPGQLEIGYDSLALILNVETHLGQWCVERLKMVQQAIEAGISQVED